LSKHKEFCGPCIYHIAKFPPKLAQRNDIVLADAAKSAQFALQALPVDESYAGSAAAYLAVILSRGPRKLTATLS